MPRRSLSPSARALAARRLRAPLEALAARYGEGFLDTDPLGLVASLPTGRDREVGGFLAAGLAHGRVVSIRSAIRELWRRADGRPYAFVRGFEPRRDARRLEGLGHRWTRDVDLAAVAGALRRLLELHGSLERAVASGLGRADADVGPALSAFAGEGRELLGPGAGRGARWFFSSPAGGAACKRLAMWLRWMVRRGAPDLGLWRRLDPSRLVLPLDTHVARIARYIGLTDLRTAGWSAALDATATLRLIDPADPVRFDFALSRMGIVGHCRHRRVDAVCRSCALDALCALG